MYQDILLPIDLNQAETQEKALRTAIACAKTFGARLHVMTVVPDFGVGIVSSYFPDDFQERAVADARERLNVFVGEKVPEDLAGQHVIAQGTIHHEIVHAVREQNVDLIVMASHRPGLSDYLLGPNAEWVVRHAACSVLVVRD
jgi:nucleotide-binding universal stress UspA family protein